MKSTKTSTKKDSKTGLSDIYIERAIDLAISEDLGLDNEGDLTSDSIIKDSCRARAVVVLKEPAIVAGLDIFTLVMERFSADIEVNLLYPEGTAFPDRPTTQLPKEIIQLEGPTAPILKGERLALNLLQRMSGIATMTGQFVHKATPFGISILDTRKTTPCLRVFEKYAVRSAGGTNHRMGLFDCILIKENHIRAAGSITSAIKAVRKEHKKKPIEVEVTNFEEITEALENKAEKLLLDNMTPDMVREAVELISGKSKIEVSGGINLSNLEGYLIKGVDYISVGALTHSVRAIDLSLLVVEITQI
ncbi:MAG: carboxylating nicotinate-nucleotide diphosphorylase [Candidatus Obscuribacterales bacterium]|nr:carboxylating nicotinate-nucleotide diphosphorylase [Candidatus Obscuribacterales bacterium]